MVLRLREDNMEKTYTKEEVVQFTVNLLSKISIPVELSEVIGVPICQAIGNLRVLSEMLEKEKVAVEAAKEGADDGRNVDPE